jgi:hypothetical protein
VLEALVQPMPIGMASEIGRTEGSLVVRRLHVHGAGVPGRWVIIDLRFFPVENTPARTAQDCAGTSRRPRSMSETSSGLL